MSKSCVQVRISPHQHVSAQVKVKRHDSSKSGLIKLKYLVTNHSKHLLMFKKDEILFLSKLQCVTFILKKIVFMHLLELSTE